ncbi:hypothetical protein Q3C35_11425 [Enterococcus faecium]|nr:hypothetical protein [Enterococcus faecium]
MMIIDVEKIKDLLADETVSAYEIEKYSGLNRMTITNLRNGDADLMRLGLGSALKLMKYIEMEESIMEITKYELRESSAVVKKEDVYEGCTLDRPGDIFTEVVKEFDNLEDAKKALENYQSRVEYRGHKEYEVIEYYVEIAKVTLEYGVECGLVDSEIIFAKGDYNI